MLPEDLQTKLTTAVDDYMERLYKSHLKSIELNFHLCSADCYQNISNCRESAQNCKTKCAEKMEQTQKRVYSDVNNTQDRFDACSKLCRSTYKLAVTNRAEEENKMAAKDKYNCLSKCVEDILEFFPKSLKNTQDFLDSSK